MTDPLRIGIIPGTTREGRFADKPLSWLASLAKRRTDATFEVVDLRDYPLSFFDEASSPMYATPKNETALKWAEKLGELDAFLFVTAEYNHSIPGVLKNALDYAYAEFNRKPAAFLGYGTSGAARAVEHLRGILAELQVATLKHAVHLNYTEFVGMLMQGKTFDDFDYLETGALAMLDELVWWAAALRAARRLDVERLAESTR